MYVYMCVCVCDTLPLDNPKTHIHTALPYITLQIKKTSDISIPSQIAPNVWILTTALSTPASTITLIYPGKVMMFIKVENPFTY